jgi:uncharacterized protein (TIGR02231 family)
VIPILIALTAMTASSRVDSVIVYPYQVQVVRTASVSVSGPGDIVFPGLPGALVDNTVRVKAPGLRIGEVQVKQGYAAEPTPEVKRLELRVLQLEDELKGLDNEAVVLQARESFLNSIKLGSPELISKDLTQGRIAVESWRGALNFMADELARVKARGITLARERTDKQREYDAAQQEYAAARSAIENRKEVRFDYDGDAGAYEVQVSYVVSGAASWSPYYELRARPGDGKVEVSYFARLEQRSGEDWERVKVVLSTTTPAGDIAAPVPTPWYLSLPVVTITGGFNAEYGRAAKAAEAPAPSSATFDGEMALGLAGQEQTRAVETGISLQYVIPGRVSLKSGESAKKLALTTIELPAEFEYLTVPRMREQAFLTGQLINTSDFVFMAGQANTYVGDEYTGSTWIGTVSPQESTKLSFGTDDRVNVKRELVKSFKSKTGLFGKTERMSYVYRTTIENYQPKPITISIVEQAPISQQGEIKVNVTKVEPKSYEENKEIGGYTWKPTLEQRGKFVIGLEFTVEYPAGQRVSGLY